MISRMKSIGLAYLAILFLTIEIQAQSNLEFLGHWTDTTLVASFAHNNTFNEVWGITNDNHEYAIIGSTFGTHIIDVTDPTNPNEVLRIEGGTMGSQIIHRDYHDYNGLLYAVADEGNNSTLQIMDYSTLPDSVSLVYDSKQYIRRAHNIFIDTSAAILYACLSGGDQAPLRPLRLFDLSGQFSPQPIADYDEFDGFRISQFHDMYIRDNIGYLNCGPSGFVIADFTDPLAPVTLATLDPSEYPQSGYNHSGWLSDDGNTYFMADENWGMDIKVMDVSALPEISIIDTIDAGSDSPFSIPHNQIVYGDLLFSSYYYDGLQVWNIEDPNNIEKIADFSTSNIEHRPRYEGAWGVYPFLPSGNILVSDMQEGLFVLKLNQASTSTAYNDFKDNISVYPNPAKDQLTISGLKNPESIIYLFDSSGNLIDQLKHGRNNNLNLQSGVYYISIHSDENSLVKKIIVAK